MKKKFPTWFLSDLRSTGPEISESARSYYLDALTESYSIDNTGYVISIYQKLSELSLRQANYTEASNYIFTAYSIKGYENTKEYDFIIYLTIGKFYEKAYENTNGYETALKYYQMAYGSAANDQDRAGAYNNIGIAYRKLKRLDEAAGWLEKARQINEGGKVYDSLGDNYYYLGEVYDDKLNYGSALTNYLSALKNDKIAEKTAAILDDLKKIAGDCFKLGRKDESIYYYKRAMYAALSLNAAEDAESISNTIQNILQSGK